MGEAQDLTRSPFSTFISLGKDFVALLRDASLFVLVILLLAFPVTLNNVLVNAGFEEGSLVGFVWKATLVRSNQALQEAQATINDLKVQLDKTSKALADIQAKTEDETIRTSIAELEEENKQLKTASANVQASVRSTITSNAPLVDRAQTTLSSGTKWVVVFGGYSSQKAAQDEIDRAVGQGIKPTSILLRQGLFRSVAVADSRPQAEQILAIAKNFRPDAYIVNMASWCPQTIDKGEYLECLTS
jgi:hypothetical protein